MSDNSTINAIPIGLSMALAQDVKVMNYFASLPASEKQRVINHTKTINSKEEMQTYTKSYFKIQ